MSANDLLTKTKSKETLKTTPVCRARALSVGSQPRRSSAKPSYGFDDGGRRRFRSQSQTICPLGTSGSASSSEFCHISDGREVWKLPIIPQTVKSNNFADITPDVSIEPQRRRSCVLPDLSRGQEEAKFRAIPLRQEHVEQADNSFDALESKSQNLVKWLRDQPQL